MGGRGEEEEGKMRASRADKGEGVMEGTKKHKKRKRKINHNKGEEGRGDEGTSRSC